VPRPEASTAIVGFQADFLRFRALTRPTGSRSRSPVRDPRTSLPASIRVTSSNTTRSEGRRGWQGGCSSEGRQGRSIHAGREPYDMSERHDEPDNPITRQRSPAAIRLGTPQSAWSANGRERPSAGDPGRRMAAACLGGGRPEAQEMAKDPGIERAGSGPIEHCLGLESRLGRHHGRQCSEHRLGQPDYGDGFERGQWDAPGRYWQVTASAGRANAARPLVCGQNRVRGDPG